MSKILLFVLLVCICNNVDCGVSSGGGGRVSSGGGGGITSSSSGSGKTSGTSGSVSVGTSHLIISQSSYSRKTEKNTAIRNVILSQINAATSSSSSSSIMNKIFIDGEVGGVGDLWFGNLERIYLNQSDTMVPFSVSFYPNIYNDEQKLIEENDEIGAIRYIEPIEIPKIRALQFIISNINNFWWCQIEISVVNGREFNKLKFISNKYSRESTFINMNLEDKDMNKMVKYVKVYGMTSRNIAESNEAFKIPELLSPASLIQFNFILLSSCLILLTFNQIGLF